MALMLQVIEASDLVPGDVILLAIGNIVPADVKLLGKDDDEPVQVNIAQLRVSHFALVWRSGIKEQAKMQAQLNEAKHWPPGPVWLASCRAMTSMGALRSPDMQGACGACHGWISRQSFPDDDCQHAPPMCMLLQQLDLPAGIYSSVSLQE